ncbi:MAG TPA: hypothetical protein VN641_22480 [Urbifossiella sp.]|jgi:hypothetical protein|nr:hypothetical protein [Urbifossiella sp.]
MHLRKLILTFTLLAAIPSPALANADPIVIPATGETVKVGITLFTPLQMLQRLLTAHHWIHP